jgi:Leucine-rich repeat (LRR) protein
LTSPNQTVEKVSGTHSSGKNADDVKSFTIMDTICFFFPKGFENVFKNIAAIRIINSGLRAISKYDLKPFPELRGIWFYYNRIIALEPDLFKFNSELRVIHFGDNRIRSIPVNIFDSLHNLDQLYLNNNICIAKDGVGKKDINLVEWEIIEKCQQNSDKNFHAKIFQLEQEIENLKNQMNRLKQAKQKIMKDFCEE